LPPTNLKEHPDNFRQDESNLSPMVEIKEFTDIPDIKRTLSLFQKMTEELKSTNCHANRLSIILKYTTPLWILFKIY
jgi:hypothetical protein